MPKAKKKTKSSKKFKIKLNKIKLNKKILIIICFIIFSLSFLFWLFWDLPLPSNLDSAQAVSTKIFDRNNELIYEIYSDERRTPVALSELPEYVLTATISIEDKDFYKHYGFSVTGITRAFYKTIFKKDIQGGSTLTQQLVKNALLSPERTIKRKLREFILSVLVEIRYPKNKILELYLNQIPYGGTAYGIGAASELYFNKEAKDLSLAEASLLAGLPAAPSSYSPFGAKPELAKNRQATVLRRMVEDGHISQEEADNAFNEELKFTRPDGIKAPPFALWIKEQLSEKYGENVVLKGGLRVKTTLDLSLQEKAQEIVFNEVEKLKNYNVKNGAAIIVRPKTGEILTMVGSKNYFSEDEDGKVNVIFANRQPGSSIKPFNYALAIKNKKITASTALADIPTCFSVFGQESYCPNNYDGQFHGAIQTRFALGNSYNIPAVRVLALNGLEEFIKFANELGINSFSDPKRYGLSLTLGGGELKPFELAQAYQVLANQGVKQDLVSILEVSDWKGKILYETNEEELINNGKRVLEQEVTFIISHILLDNNARVSAFGESSYLNVPAHPEVSVKTGTTNDRRDNWTAGYSGNAVSVVWVGNNDNTEMNASVSGVSGASPIWNKVMSEVLKKAANGEYSKDDLAQAWPQKPEDVIGTNICANTGSLKNEFTQDCPERYEYFLKDTIPNGNALRQDIQIDRILQQQATPETAPENIEMQNHLVISDPLGTIICLDCPFAMQKVNVRYPL